MFLPRLPFGLTVPSSDIMTGTRRSREPHIKGRDDSSDAGVAGDVSSSSRAPCLLKSRSPCSLHLIAHFHIPEWRSRSGNSGIIFHLFCLFEDFLVGVLNLRGPSLSVFGSPLSAWLLVSLFALAFCRQVINQPSPEPPARPLMIL